jgi:hypothetical protein
MPSDQLSKKVGRRIIDAGERAWKRAKNPDNYDATPTQVAEVEKLTKELVAALSKIKKK